MPDMRSAKLLPHPVLDYVKNRYNIVSDRQLAILLGLTAPLVSKVRTRNRKTSDELLLRIHEVFEIPIVVLKQLRNNE